MGIKAKAPGRLLTVQQLAEELSLPYTSARDLLLRGTIPRVEIPGFRRLLCERKDVERLLESWKDHAPAHADVEERTRGNGR